MDRVHPDVVSIAPANLVHERELFLRMAEGDESAFTELFYHYTPRIYPYVRKMVRSAEVTEEIVQDVFVSLWKNRLRLTGIDNYPGYVFTTAANKTYNHLNQKARESRVRQELLAPGEGVTNNTMETIDLNESRELINDLVNQLSPQKRLIFQLTRDEGLSHEEIARHLDISKNTVKNHLVETLRFLRTRVESSRGVTFLLIVFIIRANL